MLLNNLQQSTKTGRLKDTQSTHGTIIILGGYGTVGTRLSQLLAPLFPGRVVIAGRNVKRAQALAQDIGHGATAMQINAFDSHEYDKLFATPCSVIVSCLELPAGSLLAAKALRQGIHYTELTATYKAHQQLIQLNDLARAKHVCAVVGVGLMPGLSNVMAADAAARLDHVTSVNINLMLGLGEAHGLDAIKWTLRHLSETFTLDTQDGLQVVKSMSDPYCTTLLYEQRPRRFYRFNFSDQHMLLARSLHAPVSSRLAFDSRAITAVAAGLRKIGLLASVSEHAAPTVHKLTSRFAVGSDRFALQIEASGRAQGQPATVQLLAAGHKEAEATALVALYVVRQLAQNTLVAGVHSIEEVVQSANLYKYLQQHKIEIIKNARGID